MMAHRLGVPATWKSSADLGELARTPVAVVCAGVKSILDIGLTLEVLETHGVPVLSAGQDDFAAMESQRRLQFDEDEDGSMANMAAYEKAQRQALAVTDATLVGIQTDGVVLTLRSHKVTREEVRLVRDRLRQADVKVLGAVLNRYRALQAGAAAGYRYAEAYGYGAEETGSKAGSAA